MWWPILLIFMSFMSQLRVRALKILSYRGKSHLLSSTALASEMAPKPAISAKSGYFAKDLPDETFYIFDGTAMLFQAYYSRESRTAHGESFLSPSLSQELRDLLRIDEHNYALLLNEWITLARICLVPNGINRRLFQHI